jgi:cytochrome c oxidase assembly protein subunit 15
LLASGIGIVVLLLASAAFAQRKARPAQLRCAIAVVALTFALAALGQGTAGAVNPLVAPANLLGGLALVALLTWLAYDPARPGLAVPGLRVWVLAGLGLMALQIVGGALLSTTHAAAACSSLIACSGDGVAVALNGLHRLFGIILLVVNSAIAVKLFRSKAPAAVYAGAALILLTGVQIAIGAGVLAARVAVPPALWHNLIGAMLLATSVVIERFTAPR